MVAFHLYRVVIHVGQLFFQLGQTHTLQGLAILTHDADNLIAFLVLVDTHTCGIVNAAISIAVKNPGCVL